MEKLRETMIQTFRKLSVDLMEMYSLPRVAEEAKKLGLRTGAVMYPTIGRNFRRSRHRQRAKEYQKRTQAQLIIGSLRCVMSSQLQNLSPWSEEKAENVVEAKKRVEFMCEIHAEQARCHRWFVHQHAVQATSWKSEAMRQIMARGVEAVIADQCMCGLLLTWSKNVKPCLHGKERSS